MISNGYPSSDIPMTELPKAPVAAVSVIDRVRAVLTDLDDLARDLYAVSANAKTPAEADIFWQRYCGLTDATSALRRALQADS